MRISKRIAVVSAAVALCGGVSSLAGAYATVFFPGLSVCHLSVADPSTSVGTVSIVGGRYSGSSSSCSHNATVTFQLKRNIFLAPDVIDVAQTKVGVTMSFRLAEPCTAHHENDYYGHIESSGSTSGDGAHIGNCAGY
jgi:hypothetical protein